MELFIQTDFEMEAQFLKQIKAYSEEVETWRGKPQNPILSAFPLLPLLYDCLQEGFTGHNLVISYGLNGSYGFVLDSVARLIISLI